jgi:hypothetical protein
MKGSRLSVTASVSTLYLIPCASAFPIDMHAQSMIKKMRPFIGLIFGWRSGGRTHIYPEHQTLPRQVIPLYHPPSLKWRPRPPVLTYVVTLWVYTRLPRSRSTIFAGTHKLAFTSVLSSPTKLCGGDLPMTTLRWAALVQLVSPKKPNIGPYCYPVVCLRNAKIARFKEHGLLSLNCYSFSF